MVQINTNDFMKRLNKAIIFCYRHKNKTDLNNAAMLETYASYYYTEEIKANSGRTPHPINMIDRAVSIWMPFLCGGTPKFIVKPRYNIEYEPFAYTFQLALNQWLNDMKFAERTLKKVVFDSLFSEGITKTGTQRADTKRLAGYLAVTGKPYCERICRSNYVYDIVAKDREEYEFEGDEYLLPTDEARDMFPEFADKIKPDYKLWSETDPRENIEKDKPYYGELTEYSRFIDLWLPKWRDIITILPPHRAFEKILRTVDYKGTTSGPYDVLHHKIFPNYTIPIPPIYGLMELDTAINTLFTKARGQFERLKKFGVASNKKDGETGMSAKDGGMYQFDEPNPIKEMTLGGVVPEIWDALSITMNQFAEQSGITGLDYRSRAKTLGQEEMLLSNAARIANQMSQNGNVLASNLGEKLGEELWQNPTMEIRAIKEREGLYRIPVRYNQLQQRGKFSDYRVSVEMYSMQQLSPGAQFNKLWQILTGFSIPTAPLAAQQGKTLNFDAIRRDLTNYANVNTDSWYLDEMAIGEGGLNPFQSMGGVRSADTRFGSNEGDNLNNRLQYQSARAGRTTRE